MTHVETANHRNPAPSPVGGEHCSGPPLPPVTSSLLRFAANSWACDPLQRIVLARVPRAAWPMAGQIKGA